MITLDEDPAERYSPFEAELRRRLWWHLCGLESRAAEEGVARHTSIMENRQVRIPSNLNDVDLQPDMKQPVAPRKGVAETSFVILRFEVYSLAHNLWATKKKFQLAGRSDDAKGVQEEQRAALETFKSDQRRDLISFCDTSRRLDWLVTTLYEAMCVCTYHHVLPLHPPIAQLTTPPPDKNAHHNHPPHHHHHPHPHRPNVSRLPPRPPPFLRNPHRLYPRPLALRASGRLGLVFSRLRPVARRRGRYCRVGEEYECGVCGEGVGGAGSGVEELGPGRLRGRGGKWLGSTSMR